MSAQASSIAASLQRNAYLGIALAVLILTVAPFLRVVHDLTFWLIWPVLLASSLVTLGIAAHLLFDAALFRLVAANPIEEAGLIELDRTLEKWACVKQSAPPDRSSKGSPVPGASSVVCGFSGTCHRAVHSSGLRATWSGALICGS